MQWTVEQIIAELAHLDAQMLSYVEHVRMHGHMKKCQMKRLSKFLASTTEMLSSILAELDEQQGNVRKVIIHEQNARWTSDMKPEDVRRKVESYRD